MRMHLQRCPPSTIYLNVLLQALTNVLRGPAALGAAAQRAPVPIQRGSGIRCCEDFWLRGTCEKDNTCAKGTHRALFQVVA